MAIIMKKQILLIIMAITLFSLLSPETVSAEKVEETVSESVPRNTLLDVADAVPHDAETKTLRFYMPEEWRNSYNDSYDGRNHSSCTAGIYWWESTYSPKEIYGEAKSDWPGYSIHKTDPADSNIFVAEVPLDVSTVIFNNTVDGEQHDNGVDRYNAAFRTVNINAKHYLPYEDGYGFYVDGTKNCDGMIYVCEKATDNVYDLLINNTYKGAWFYYYGDGKYGYYKTLEEAEQNNAVYSGGAWPHKENTTDPRVLPTKAETDMTKPASYTEAVSVDKAKRLNPMKVTAKSKTVKAKKLKKSKVTVSAITVKNAKGKLSYKKLSGSKKLSVTKKGKITIKKGTKKGTYKLKVKITAKGNSQYLAKSVTKTVRVKVK